jgi:hypothetical protein
MYDNQHLNSDVQSHMSYRDAMFETNECPENED